MKTSYPFRLIQFIVIMFFVLCNTSCSIFKDKTVDPVSSYGDIEGVIKENGSNLPVEGVSITILPVKLASSTDAKGIYSFKRLDPGEYSLQTTHQKYEPKSLKINVLAGQKSSADFFLDARKSVLTTSPERLDFANGEISKTIILKNAGPSSVGFSAKPNENWILVNPTTGTLKENESFPVTITVDRKSLIPNTYSGSIIFNADANSFSFNITLVVPNPNAPSVVTRKPTNITNSSAEVLGEVTNLGSSNIIELGHCWSENSNPTITDNRTKHSSGGLGPYNSSITNLVAGKQYFVRAYATNGHGTGYGESFSFEAAIEKTPPVVIMVGTPTDITSTSARITSRITNSSGLAVTQYGHVWSTSPNPTVANVSNLRTAFGPAQNLNIDFTSQLTSLKSGTKYYVRAYAVNSIGTGYNDGDIIVEDRNDYDKTLSNNECVNNSYSYGRYCFKNGFNEHLLLYSYNSSTVGTVESNILIAPGATVCTPLINLYTYPFTEVKFYFKTTGAISKSGFLTLNVEKCKSSFFSLTPDTFYLK